MRSHQSFSCAVGSWLVLSTIGRCSLTASNAHLATPGRHGGAQPQLIDVVACSMTNIAGEAAALPRLLEGRADVGKSVAQPNTENLRREARMKGPFALRQVS